MEVNMDVDVASTSSSSASADLVVLSWNIEHLRTSKLMRTVGNFEYFTETVARSHIAFLYEAHSNVSQTIADSLNIFFEGTWKALAQKHFDELLTVVWNTEVVQEVTLNKGVSVKCRDKATEGFRFPLAFDVTLKSSDKLVIAGWHAPGPAMAMAQTCIQRLCAISEIDLFVGDFNFEPHLDEFGATEARRSSRLAQTYHLKEVTEPMLTPSTYTIKGLSKTRNGPLDRCFANDTLAYDVVVEIVQPKDYEAAKNLTDHCPLFAYLKKKTSL